MMGLNCIQFIGLLLLYQVLNVSSHGGFLKPDKPLRRIGEYLTFHCESPEDYAKKPDVYIEIVHNGTALKKLKHSLNNNNAALKAEYNVTDISVKTAGTWECRMTNDDKNSFRQNLIIVQGNTTPALVEDRSTVVIDCLTDEDKTRGVHVEWLENNEPVPTTDGFSVELKDVSLKDATKNLSCIVSQNGSDTDADNEASTSIYKPFSVVQFVKESDEIRISVCGWTHNLTIYSSYNDSSCISSYDENAQLNNTGDCVHFKIKMNMTCPQICLQVQKAILCKDSNEISGIDMKQAESKGSNTGTIVGVAVTVVVFLGFLVGLVICWKRNNLRKCCTATTNEAKTEAQDDASNDAGLPLVTLPQIQQLNGVHTRKE